MLLEVEGLKKHFPASRRRLIKALDGVSFSLKEGENLGIVGESGCGKSTLARCIIRAIEPDHGEVIFYRSSKAIDITALDERQLRSIRPYIQFISQDPGSAMNPRMTIQEIVGEPLLIHGIARGKKLEERVEGLIHQVGLCGYMKRRPSTLSNGQKQRVTIARALALEPLLLIADEPIASLDLSMQAQIINLLDDLQKRYGLTLILISHDLFTVRTLSTTVAVMYGGRFVEVADKGVLFSHPSHPYTQALLMAAKSLMPGGTKAPLLPGEAVDMASLPSGCAFHPRCRFSKDICRKEEPPLTPTGTNGTLTACHRHKELDLTISP